MRKVFSKKLTPLFLVLLIASSPISQVHAGYSDDPDCKPVSDGAKFNRDAVLGTIDTVTSETGQAIARAKSCVDNVVSGANRAIPDFGGGLAGLISSQISSSLAQRACQLLGNGTNVASMVPFRPGVPAAASVQDVISSPALESQVSVFQRLSNIFSGN